jgi:DsbC/DsbD-like thiol-disulfide interchange protein
MMLILSLLLVGSVPVKAQSSFESSWVSSAHSRSRLIVGEVQKDGTWHLALEVELDPTFKTYWRTPGDSGFIPRLETSSSQNLANVEFKWPVPKRFNDETGTFNGYEKRLLLPLIITAQKQNQPVIFRVNFDYGVCHLQCIPTQAKHEITLDIAALKSPSPHANMIAKALIKAPLRLVDQEQIASLVEEVKLLEKDKNLALRVQLSPYERNTELFVEGPEGWVLGAPQRLASASTILGARPHPVVLLVPIEFYPKGQKPNTTKVPFRLTLASPDGAYEIEQVLDISPQSP